MDDFEWILESQPFDLSPFGADDDPEADTANHTTTATTTASASSFDRQGPQLSSAAARHNQRRRQLKNGLDTLRDITKCPKYLSQADAHQHIYNFINQLLVSQKESSSPHQSLRSELELELNLVGTLSKKYIVPVIQDAHVTSITEFCFFMGHIYAEMQNNEKVLHYEITKLANDNDRLADENARLAQALDHLAADFTCQTILDTERLILDSAVVASSDNERASKRLCIVSPLGTTAVANKCPAQHLDRWNQHDHCSLSPPLLQLTPLSLNANARFLDL
ncbi:hypothetical protein [Sporisorium scitamineum]|uniref:Uncharacterized protein n=1 Tax=Sporisorium scitamineum TaxID=49012 RepID=A0A0F7S1U5_9BASI|nr:hypothetical protein [Sporisorium scitamineum]